MKPTAVLAVLAAVAGNVSASPTPSTGGDMSPRAPIQNGNVWWHTCGNCKCNHTGARENFSGATDCMKISTAIRAVGLSRSGAYGKMTTCTIFSDDNCQREVQSVGVHLGQTYGCTAFNQDSRSIKCYYNV
ncbi:hypothetical protein QBC37DRAFT_376261 [Rhypophila decipiens]|uniref:Uncharacterized protein n=1 Tax=Rhypophila decipiens TaxID=261697 RepID=A0AAN7B5X0_9PEZI|nr:hypothetical protein QBC37DRAFT_376261 [Rhypophila decipiens]